MSYKRRSSYGRFETYSCKNMEITCGKITATWWEVRLHCRNEASVISSKHLKH